MKPYKPKLSDRFTDQQTYSTKGVRVRALRSAFCEELNANPALRAALDTAAGGDAMPAFRAAEMTGHGGNLRMTGTRPSGKPAVLMVDVQFAEPVAEGVFDHDAASAIVVARDSTAGRVTIAPSEWFTHSGNAAYAVNALTFEELMPVVSESLQVLLGDGIDRVRDTFNFITRPRSEAPLWAKMRIGWPYR